MEEIVELFEKLQEELHDKLVNLSDFVIKEEIGKGATGIVYLATSSKTNQLVAIKESKYQALNERQLTLYCNEIQVLSKCYNHPFLLKFIGFTNRFPYTIITEHIPNGSLWNALHYSIEPLTGDQKNKIAIGIAAGMAALHDQNIIHRDLKSLNVLLDNDYLPVICDFGASKLLDIDSDEPTSPTNRVGTLAWMAPELFTNSTFSNKVDVYSFAVLLWELETCQVPFKGVKSEQIPEMVVNQERPPIPTTAPISLKKLIRLCWHPNPDKRPTFSAILDKFLHKKVYFEGATDSSIHFIQEKLENWKRTIDITLKETRNNSVEHVKQIFLKQDSKEILQYIEGLNENNCRTFYSVILEMIESEEATTILLPALYGLLYIITENEKCLLQYVEIDDFIKLPFNRNELKEISLSILIPIFEKYPNSISLELIYTLKSPRDKPGAK
ncbi:TKL family protein kinase [Histomonas meleagridis]|uniref:TKL family protein kinase n=1 Tax=Histomonas meleagridis TaxID=135588 RepID=UPI003559A5AA|nr:TKL family protein kinase [Histomonas meleagridis]KAH0797248.1 TKL family protein kinase [Histomonas meleagridis]